MVIISHWCYNYYEIHVNIVNENLLFGFIFIDKDKRNFFLLQISKEGFSNSKNFSLKRYDKILGFQSDQKFRKTEGY